MESILESARHDVWKGRMRSCPCISWFKECLIKGSKSTNFFAERSGGAEYEKMGAPQLRSTPLKPRSTAPRILNPSLIRTFCDAMAGSETIKHKFVQEIVNIVSSFQKNT